MNSPCALCDEGPWVHRCAHCGLLYCSACVHVCQEEEEPTLFGGLDDDD